MNDEVKPMTTRRKDRKPKLSELPQGFNPPFEIQVTGWGHGIIHTVGLLNVNMKCLPVMPLELADVVCDALNQAYPVVRKGKGAKK